MTRSSEPPSYPIKSVGNALELLLRLRFDDRLTVTGSAEALDVAPSTAHRLLAMLAHYEFVVRDEATRDYRAGPALLGIGLAALQNFDLRSVARPHLERLVEEVEETVNLLVLEEDAVRFVDCVETRKALRIASRVGLRRPAHSTSVGKAIWALMPPAEFDQVLQRAGRLESLTPNTLVDQTRLADELALIRERGYATNIGESDLEIRAVGVVIATGPGQPQAGLAISAPSSRMPSDRVSSLAAAARRTAAAIEDDLGRATPRSFDRAASLA